MSGNEALNDDLRKEISLLKGRIEGLEKELMSQEAELKAAKAALKDKNNDPIVKNLAAHFQQISLHLNEIQGVQKEVDKIFQHHKSTWDLQNLQTKLNLIENHQSMYSEEIFASDNNRCAQTTDKDKNNNSTITAKTKPRSTEKVAQKSNENLPPFQNESILKEKKNMVKIADPPASGTQTLKRKRDAKSPSARVTVDSPSSDASSRKQSTTTATILVSKTKTKTGLPLLIKK